MAPELFVDTSSYNTITSWPDYRAWSSRIAMKSTEGVGYIDPTYATNRANAKAAGVTAVWHYHYGRPDINAPAAEANFQREVIGAIGAQDLIVLDFEVNDARANAEWAYQFLAEQAKTYPGQVAIYASSAYILERLNDARLPQIAQLWLADWTYDPASRPDCPAPWTSYIALQYSDRATVPGIAGAVDADVFIGESSMTIPQGWADDGTTLTAPNGVPVTEGFRTHVLASNWNADNWPLTSAQGRSPLEMSNPALGAGTQQIFRMTTLEWTASRGVFVAWTGPEIVALRTALAKATSTPVTPTTDNTALITTLTTLSQTLTTVNASIQQALSTLKSS